MVASGHSDFLTSPDSPGALRIQPMTPADMNDVLAVEGACQTHPWTERQFREELENPFSSIDLGRIDKELAGFICSWLVAGELHILDVATAPAFRRRKVASRLVEHVLARSRAQGMEKAFLEVRAGNQGAIGLYLAFGFRQIDCRLRYYTDGEDALVMELVEDGGRGTVGKGGRREGREGGPG